MPADAVDRILLTETTELAAGPACAAVLDDPAGELTGSLERLWPSAQLRLYHDSLTAERACRAGLPTTSRARFVEDLAQAVAGAEVVVARLPAARAALDELAETVALHAAAGVRLLAGGREKHLNRTMNEVLAAHFSQVRASLGRGKARVLIAGAPRPATASYPRRADHPELGLTVCAHGAAFAGTKIDSGTRLLLTQYDRLPKPGRALDLGCGTGVLAAALAARFPDAEVLAVDDSRAAVASAGATLAANRLAGSVNLCDELPPELAALDLVVCNPPFHRGTAKDSTPAFALFAAASRALRPGSGELWVVYNAHLPYLPALRRLVGPTEIAARDRHYLVTRSVSRA